MVAVSHDPDQIEKFRNDNRDKTLAIVKVKRKLLDPSVVEDLELVRYGDSYVPAQYYQSIKDLSADRDHDLQYAVEVIIRELTDTSIKLPNKDAKILTKAAMILNDMIEPGEVPSLDVLKELKNMDNAYRGAIT